MHIYVKLALKTLRLSTTAGSKGKQALHLGPQVCIAPRAIPDCPNKRSLQERVTGSRWGSARSTHGHADGRNNYAGAMFHRSNHAFKGTGYGRGRTSAKQPPLNELRRFNSLSLLIFLNLYCDTPSCHLLSVSCFFSNRRVPNTAREYRT